MPSKGNVASRVASPMKRSDLDGGGELRREPTYRTRPHLDAVLADAAALRP